MAASTASSNVGKNDKTTCDSSVASASSASKNVGIPYTKRSGGRSRHYNVKVQFRLDGGVYGVLRRCVPNVSMFLRRLVYDAVERLPTIFECEELRLEVEVAMLCDELRRVHGYQTALLKHGSYAKSYLEKLRGGVIVDRKPFHIREPLPEISKQELETVQQVVEYRELLAQKLNLKLKRLMELKKANLQLEGGEKA
ncbi:MAG: hypothetical protein QXH87_04830 [Candidatus Bathyarchaeia archaeon]